MQRECLSGHPISHRGLLRLSWCPDCARYELRCWATAVESSPVVNLIPEWAEAVTLEDDEWFHRTAHKYVTSLAQTVRLLSEDERSGVLRLL